MIDTRFLSFVRAAIAIKNIPKKKLARKCKVSRPQFSEMIHGDREMPEGVRKRLIKDLDIQEHYERLNETVELCKGA